MSSNTNRFNKFIYLVRRIFPEIQQITVPPFRDANNRQVEILVWGIDPDSNRDDLAMPLTSSGTGIGQVLAILYVVLTAENPTVIIIDEPQSFLHPGAARKLIEILKHDFSQHQFIITTHSPTALTAANPTTLLRIRKQDNESVTEVIDVSKTEKLREFLLGIGTRLSDVFGADNVLWVEGPTEEQCFPLILEELAGQLLLGTVILGVRNTGDFVGKHSKMVLEIYNRLSKSNGLLPAAVGFIFDREDRSATEMIDLKRQSNDRTHFLSRKMYENYLLNPHAIAYVISTIDGFSERLITLEEVELCLQKHRLQTGDDWLVKEDGAKLLQAVFNDLSETRVNYEKIEYGFALTEWLIANAPEDLEEVKELLVSVLALKQVNT